MLDNNSTDWDRIVQNGMSCTESIAEFKESIHWYPWLRVPEAPDVNASHPSSNQIDALKSIWPIVQKQSEWVLLTDVDEFAFGVRGRFDTAVQQLVNSTDRDFDNSSKHFHVHGAQKRLGQICMPWYTLGGLTASSHHVLDHPACVTSSNVRGYSPHATSGRRIGKCAVLTDALAEDGREIMVHRHNLNESMHVCLCSDGRPCQRGLYLSLPCPAIMPEDSKQHVRLNHYPIQSIQRWYEVRKIRGGANRLPLQQKIEGSYERLYTIDFHSVQLDLLLANKSVCRSWQGNATASSWRGSLVEERAAADMAKYGHGFYKPLQTLQPKNRTKH